MSNTADVLMVDGQFVSYLPPMENFELLWKNQDPTASFAGQQITIANDDYDLLLIMVYLTNGSYSISNIIAKGTRGWFSAEQTTSSSYVTISTRSISPVGDTTLQFSSGYKQNSNGSRTTDNTVLVPYRIYGIKLQGSALGNAGNVYSTTEHIVGKWIDGKPLYEKTINTGALPNADTVNISTGTANVKRFISISGYAYRASGNCIPLPFVNTTTNSALITTSTTNNTVSIKTGGNLSEYIESYITLRYTKTTD